jgi:2',3'-cyclic-nucleotide 2'-phosphodiesterase (5'-nucleotidase family)
MAVAARWTAPARRRRWTLPLVCALGRAVWTWPARGSDGQVTISVVGTTDLHGRIDPDDAGHGGLAWFGGYLANLRRARAADGGGVVLLDTGDTWQGGITSNLSEGAVVIDAYNALGYTALAVGNHDFEYGAVDRWEDTADTGADPRGALKARAVQARFPFLAANLIDAGALAQRPADRRGRGRRRPRRGGRGDDRAGAVDDAGGQRRRSLRRAAGRHDHP